MKKAIVTVGAVALAGAILFIQPVQSLTVSALSAFRVENTKTIQITLADMQELMSTKNEQGINFDQENMSKVFSIKEQQRPETVTLNDVNEFKMTEFDVDLPRELEEEQPRLLKVNAATNEYTVHTSEFNEMVNAAGIETQLDESYDNQKISLSTSPTFIAEYEKYRLIATQGLKLDSNEELGKEIWNILLDMPGIPQNLRSQLAKVELSGREVYLPVIMGLGREVNLGGTTGYIYTSSDMKEVIQSLNDSLNIEDNSDEEMGMLVWVKNDVLYTLSGSVSDDELAKVARSVR